MNKNELKERVVAAIEENKDIIIAAGRKIYSNPEFGYKEFETTKTVSDFFKNELGLEVEEKIAYTGCRARINEDKSGPKVAILGELDGISCSEHPDANSIGASHTCGHNVQIAGMLGAAVGLIKSGVFKELDGKVDFIATPAEEFIELAYRSKLKADGHIKYFGGKQELIRKGAFDDVDMSIMFHVLDTGDKKVLVGPESNGFIGKEVKFIGKEAHAGSAPYEGINALNAAMLAINNVNAQRETFKEADRVRFHPIITKGGDIVNVVPADVRMESYVRARTIDSMIDANKKVNRALIAGAMAVGAEIEITELPGYLPILKHNDMEKVLRENLHFIGLKDEDIIDGGDFTGSFDFGDVSHIIPTLHPMFGGIKGALHTRGYSIVDEEYAYLAPAKSMALTVVDLLFNNAETGKEILKNFKPVMTKDEYLAFMESNDKTIKA
ncbi:MULTISPECIES: M20 family metallopeptidase [Fusobacterium]|jgi:amidohydrolase|uniref:Peptidase M20 domain-containing protein 2 n=1 Tax=Fusobacterium varium ATCC 27725 TaxID=469618 RepID=A0ABN5JHB2_FUSVA|nr:MULTISPECIES: amidohydrolase [Fusobacterium]AVQ29702.1 amidohydrolase [Fusobacterium varium ATCC 27725]EES64480.1 amidohydrolase [Fusobacterium varium ATCC 27725]MCF0169947.1 amidohydrolase [Fusobacterium varium]MCF2674320.1 amidohydrolase [Fusobacterium varium]MCI6031874.1 amidohydrolase [Fusobacterium varium]